MYSSIHTNYLSLFSLWTAVTTLFLAFTACQQQNTADTKTVPSDEAITSTIQAQLDSARDVPAEEIDVSAKNGVATLTGSTGNLLAKRRATEIAESVYGVLSVVNNIKVTADRPDAAINRDIDQVLDQDPVTESWKVSTTVNNGLVTLEGIVSSWQERRLVETLAQGVKGVKGIDNKIIVQYDGHRPDQEIQSEIERTLMMDSRIGHNRVKVDVSEGRVTLSGSVGSAMEKTLAVQKARIAGVDSVVADNLEVHPEYQNKLLRNEELANLTSDEIKRAIENALTYDPRVPESQINVSIDNGTVTLTGSVENLGSKIAAEQDILHTAGVNNVKNNIKVERKVVIRPGDPTSDQSIEKRIHEAIIRNPYIEQTTKSVNVDVEKGVVGLTGKVDSQFEKNQIERVTRNVAGVVDIKNELEVLNDTQS